MKTILTDWRMYVFVGTLFLFIKLVNIADLVVKSYVYSSFYVPEEDIQALNLEQFFDKE